MSKKRVFKEGFVKRGPNYIMPVDLVPLSWYREAVINSLEVVFECFLVHSPKHATDGVAPVIIPRNNWAGRIIKTNFSTCRELAAEYIINLIRQELIKLPQAPYQVITCVYFSASPEQVKRIRSCLNFTFRQMERSLHIERPLSLKILQRTSGDPNRKYILALRFPLKRHNTSTWLRSIASVSFMLLMVRMTIFYYRHNVHQKRPNFIKIFNEMPPFNPLLPTELLPFINCNSDILCAREQGEAMELKWKEVRELFVEQRDLLAEINVVGQCTGIQGALRLASKIFGGEK